MADITSPHITDVTGHGAGNPEPVPRVRVYQGSTRSNPTRTPVYPTRNPHGFSNPCQSLRSTHTINNCYWPGGGKEGQFPPNFGQRARANIASSSQNTVEHFVLSARVPDTLGISGVVIDDKITPTTALVSRGFQVFNGGKVPTFIDSGASNTMFLLKDDFVTY